MKINPYRIQLQQHLPILIIVNMAMNQLIVKAGYIIHSTLHTWPFPELPTIPRHCNTLASMTILQRMNY